MLALALLAGYSCWVFVTGVWMVGYAIGIVVFVPFVFTASLLLCYLLGLGKGPPGADN
jgi:hypothetical protein